MKIREVVEKIPLLGATLRRYYEWREDCERHPDDPETGMASVLSQRDFCSMLMYYPHSQTYSIVVVLRADSCPYVVKRIKTASNIWVRKYNENWEEDFKKWSEDAARSIKNFASQLGLILTGEIFSFERGLYRLEFSSPPPGFSFSWWIFKRKEEANLRYHLIREFIEREIEIRSTESEYDLEWVPEYFFTWPKQKIERKFGWTLDGYEIPRPVPLHRFRRDAKALLGATLGFLLGAKFGLFKRLGEVAAKEIIGTPEISSWYKIEIEIDGQKMPVRPGELIKWTRLWKQYYANEYSHRTWNYWQNQGLPLDQAARKAAEDLEDILNQLGAQYYVKWRLADQVKEVRDAGGGTAVVRIRPLIFDMMYHSTLYPDKHFLVKEGIVTSYPPDHLVWVVGGKNGAWVTVETPPATCSNPFGGQCETGCLVGCEAACEGNPCLLNCQSGCQTWCETSCQTCSNNWAFCGYTLSCDCVDNNDGTVTVSGRICYETPTGGCRPQAGETVSIYHAAWGTSYTTRTDANGYYSLTKPKPAGSTPIYVRWTDPNGTEHECSTSACLCPSGTKPCPDGSCVPSDGCCNDSDCPPGQRCVNGTCQPGGCTSDADCPPGYVCVNGQCVKSSNTGPSISNLSWNLSALCETGFEVSGRLEYDGAAASGCVQVLVNGTPVAQQEVNGSPPPWGTSGAFNISVPKSAYASLLNCSSATTIQVRGIVPSPQQPSCTAGGAVVTESTTASNCCCTPATVTCSVSATQVDSGGTVLFSGYVKNSSGVGCANQPVEILLDGNLIDTVLTDSTGRFSKSVRITCSSTGWHTLEARVGSLSCSKSVRCVPSQRTATVTLTVQEYSSFLERLLKGYKGILTVDGEVLDQRDSLKNGMEDIQYYWLNADDWDTFLTRLTDRNGPWKYTATEATKILDAIKRLSAEFACAAFYADAQVPGCPDVTPITGPVDGCRFCQGKTTAFFNISGPECAVERSGQSTVRCGDAGTTPRTWTKTVTVRL